jgi:hypothetical protein
VRCEHYDLTGPRTDGRPGLTITDYCRRPADPDTAPPRCGLHVGTVTGTDRLEAENADEPRRWAATWGRRIRGR